MRFSLLFIAFTLSFTGMVFKNANSKEMSPAVKEKLKTHGIRFSEEDFISYDLNKDDVLTKSELDEAKENASEDKEIFQQRIDLAMEADKNNDGKLERSEYREYALGMLNKLLNGEDIDPIPSNAKKLNALRFEVAK